MVAHVFRRRVVSGVAAILIAGLGLFGVSVTLATPAMAGVSVTVKDVDGNVVDVGDASCDLAVQGCVTFSGGVLSLGYLGSYEPRIGSVQASGDLIIHVYGGMNTIENDGTVPAISVGGSLTVLGKVEEGLAQLSVASPGATAIQIPQTSSFTLGGVTDDPVKLSVQAGTAPHPDSVNVNIGSQYGYDPQPPGGGGGDEPPAPPTPGTLSVGGVNVFDAAEQVCTADNDGLPGTTDVPGVSLTCVFINDFVSFWSMTFDGSRGPYGQVVGSGGGLPFISLDPASGDVEIGAGEDDLSFNFTQGADVVFIGDGRPGFLLAGGLYAEGGVTLDGAYVQIGSEELPSPRGVESSSLSIGNDRALAGMKISTAATNPGGPAAALSGVPGPPNEPGRPLHVDVSQGAYLDIEAAGDATHSTESITVSRGGIVDMNFVRFQGEDEQAPGLFYQYMPYQDELTCIDQETPISDFVTEAADEESDGTLEPYVRNTTPTSLDLWSLSPMTRNLSWEQGLDATNPVVGGDVCVLAARGVGRVDAGTFFSFEIEEGSEVTIKLLPEHEHQFTSGKFEVLGPVSDSMSVLTEDVAPGSVNVSPILENAADYTFDMPEANISLSTVFDQMPDAPADVSGTAKVQSATLQVPSADINGNASLTISDIQAPINANQFTQTAGPRTVAGYLDVSLSQVIQQGDTGGVWENNITELTEPATISMVLDASLRGFTDYLVLHEHNGEVNQIPASYDSATGMLTFETDGFSTYAIAHAPAVPANPFTYDATTNQWVYLAWASGLGLLITVGGALLWRGLSVR